MILFCFNLSSMFMDALTSANKFGCQFHIANYINLQCTASFQYFRSFSICFCRIFMLVIIIYMRLFLRLFYDAAISISEVRYHGVKSEKSDYEQCDERYVGERWCLFKILPNFNLNIAEKNQNSHWILNSNSVALLLQ